MMIAIKEGFDLLDSKGVDRKVQQLFLEVLKEDNMGRLSADYNNCNGKIVDQELVSVSKVRFPSEGIIHFSEGSPALSRSVFISDSLINLIFFAKHFDKRIKFSHSAFIACAAWLDKKLFLVAVRNYPNATKYYALFGHSLIGRIKDCKVQHWLKGKDCLFRVEKNEVVSTFRGMEFRMSLEEFSLSKHLKQLGTRQALSTYKPMDKNIDNYYRFNYF